MVFDGTAYHGYETIAVLPDFAPGHQQHFLKKVLARQEGHAPEGGREHQGTASANRSQLLSRS
jgi:hypothetical protein